MALLPVPTPFRNSFFALHRSDGADANGSEAAEAGRVRIKKGGSMAATNDFHAPVVFVGE